MTTTTTTITNHKLYHEEIGLFNMRSRPEKFRFCSTEDRFLRLFIFEYWRIFANELREDFFGSGHVDCLYQSGRTHLLSVLVLVIIRPASYICKAKITHELIFSTS